MQEQYDRIQYSYYNLTKNVSDEKDNNTNTDINVSVSFY